MRLGPITVMSALSLAAVASCEEGPPPTSGMERLDTSTTATIVGSGGQGGVDGSVGGGATSPPEIPPPELIRYLTGSPDDAVVQPTGPGLILMGGGADVDEAFEWWRPLLAGGDVVVLRTSGSDGYNDYLYDQIGGVDSVETLIVDTPALADAPYVVWQIAHAEGVFIAGGDQATYLEAWKDRDIEEALMVAWDRGAVIGGTSAGCAVLGAVMFAAYEGTVYSDEALEDPFNMYMTLDRDFLSIPRLAQTITDTHFAERDRMGRLAGFVARTIEDGWLPSVHGLGVDEGTALVVDAGGTGTVMGEGAVYLLRDNGAPQQCSPGVSLEYANLPLHRLNAGDTVQLPEGTTTVPATTISASAGVTVPANPY